MTYGRSASAQASRAGSTPCASRSRRRRSSATSSRDRCSPPMPSSHSRTVPSRRSPAASRRSSSPAAPSGTRRSSRSSSARKRLWSSRAGGTSATDGIVGRHASLPSHMSEHQQRKWLVLAVVGTAFFMTILDVAIVNVAIPSIQKDLDIKESTVQWVLTAYAITFGGFLLLGGRMADLLGRRRIFVAGLVLFTIASLTCGLANSAGVLIVSRAVQGIGAAIISPAALSIVTTTFEEGAERNKALGIWGALGGSGAAVGVLLGGILTKYLGWEWIFFVNVPVGVLVLALTRPLVPESHADLGHRQFDALGAVLVTAGNALFVYAISKAPEVGWATGRTIGLLVLSVALIGAFVIWEERTHAPLVPFSIFRIRTLTAANIVGFLIGAVTYSNFFILTLYVQGVLHWSALKTGVTFLATAGTAVIWAGVA